MRVIPMVRTGTARMLKPTTKAVTAPEKESDFDRRPCTLSNVAVISGTKGMGAMADSRCSRVSTSVPNASTWFLHNDKQY
jgi:hypothetical protein